MRATLHPLPSQHPVQLPLERAHRRLQLLDLHLEVRRPRVAEDAPYQRREGRQTPEARLDDREEPLLVVLEKALGVRRVEAVERRDAAVPTNL